MEEVSVLKFHYDPEEGLCTRAEPLLEPGSAYEIYYYESQWGREFDKKTRPWTQGQRFDIQCTWGRSSHGYSPFLRIGSSKGHILAVMVAWSGNWGISIDEHGAFQAEIPYKASEADGSDRSGTCCTKAAGDFPCVYIFSAADGDWDKLTAKIHTYGRKYLYPPAKILPVEWNPWWTFEDVLINEDVFLENARAARDLGVELCTLDAGWYGESGKIHWSRQQGDWDIVNTERFPHGLKFLSDHIHALGMAFGLWAEPEALGRESRLIREHPEFEAICRGRRYDNSYVCLGNPDGAKWLLDTLTHLLDTACPDWMKLDFNMDPGEGCTRTDHGHGAGDGLFWHYKAYYDILKKLRNKYPQLVIENCSSGGLRCDTAMFSLTHLTFLSDVDETSHSLDSFYELSRFIPPEHILHWAWSETRTYDDGSHAFEGFEIREDTPEDEIRYTLRAAMLHVMGFSRNFAALPENIREIFREEIRFYKTEVRPLLTRARVFHLLNADGGMALQYQDGDRRLLFVFCKKDFVQCPLKIPPVHLKPEQAYNIKCRGTGNTLADAGRRTGQQLMEEGISLLGEPKRAWIFQIKPLTDTETLEGGK